MDFNVEKYNEDIIRETRNLVRIKSVKEPGKKGAPFGDGIRKSLDYTLDLCNKLGFKTKYLDGYLGYAEYGQGDDLVAILVHLDVVPEGNGWTKEPYGGEVIDGKMYGRGVNDDKGAAISSIYALKSIMDSGLKMNKRFRIIFGCDEEQGWEDIRYYLDHEEKPTCGFSPDGPFPIVNTEKGILRLKLKKDIGSQDSSNIRVISLVGGDRPNMVPEEATCLLKINKYTNSVKTYLNNFTEHNLEITENEDGISIRTKGKSAHGSEPYLGVNAIVKMISILTNLEDIDEDLYSFLNFIDSYIGSDVKGEKFKIDFQDEVSGFLTLNPGVLNYDGKSVHVTLDIRYPVTFKGDYIVSKITEKALKNNIEVELLEDKEPLFIDEDNPLIQKLKNAYERVTGNKAELISLKGGTYARAIDNAVAFGPIMPGKEDTAHQEDEYLEIDDLLISARIYAQAIYELNNN
jgi:succinyl-diaminopimelate desuccinylase